MELDRFTVIFIEPLMVERELTDSLTHALALVDSIGGASFILLPPGADQ